MGKQKQSVRELAKRMSARGYQGSKNNIQRHIKCPLGHCWSYHGPMNPKLSEKNVLNSLMFSKKAKRGADYLRAGLSYILLSLEKMMSWLSTRMRL